MRARHLIAMAVAALLLLGGAAAAGAAAPADQASDDAPNENAPDVVGPDASSPDAGSQDDAAGSVGPSDGLPEQVPGHVSSILETIQSFQDGSVDHLGEALSGLLGSEPADGGSGPADEADGAAA